jgi:hypothetical protein
MGEAESSTAARAISTPLRDMIHDAHVSCYSTAIILDVALTQVAIPRADMLMRSTWPGPFGTVWTVSTRSSASCIKRSKRIATTTEPGSWPI